MKRYIVRGMVYGGISGLLASLCCLGPVFLILIGLGTMFGITGVCLTSYRLGFFIIGLVFLGLSSIMFFRKEKKLCEINNSYRIMYIVVGFVVMIIVYLMSVYLLVPEIISVNGLNSCSI